MRTTRGFLFHGPSLVFRQVHVLHLGKRCDAVGSAQRIRRSDFLVSLDFQVFLQASLFLVAMPFVPSSFLLLVVRPGAPIVASDFIA